MTDVEQRSADGVIWEGVADDRAHSFASREGQLAALLAEAVDVRTRARGDTVTYSPKVFIPLTKACRDVCHYCTFARSPSQEQSVYLSQAEVLAIAQAGERAGCREALFTLGDKPELRYPRAHRELQSLGFDTTIEYLAHCAELVLGRTGLLPHLNHGVCDDAGLRQLREVSASQGLMLEAATERLSETGQPHHGSPDKRVDVRVDAIRRAGELRIPFTSGILVGIGETRAERIDALLVLRDLHRAHGHLQEIIVQNFRAKPQTKMALSPEPTIEDHLWTIAVARLIMPGDVAIQAPPNLAHQIPRLLEAGVDDFGGVSPVTIDHVNPEAPWPSIEVLASACESVGLMLLPRLTVYPRFVDEAEKWLEPRVITAVLRSSDSRGLARETSGWSAGESPRPPARWRNSRGAPSTAFFSAMRTAESAGELTVEEATALLSARGPEVTELEALADQLRRDTCGDVVSYVVCRNINYTNICYFRCGFCAFSKGSLAENLRGPAYLLELEEIVRRSIEAWDRGATEVCLQGGIHPGFVGSYYMHVVDAIKEALPAIHVHAFSPLEIWQGAVTQGMPLTQYLRGLQASGLGSLPGTAAEILDDTVRARLCPDKVSTGQWLDVMRAAHHVGLRSTSTIMFGHIERPVNQARHLLAVRDLQRETGGFTEFVPLPFVHREAPIWLRGHARNGPTFEENVVLHAAARVILHPHITNIQASWVKLGPDGVATMLNAGVNDLGGTLMNESISRAAGAVHGQEFGPGAMDRLISEAGRIPKQRTTLYADAPQERVSTSLSAPPLIDTVPPVYDDRHLTKPQQLVRPGLERPPGWRSGEPLGAGQ